LPLDDFSAAKGQGGVDAAETGGKAKVEAVGLCLDLAHLAAVESRADIEERVEQDAL